MAKSSNKAKYKTEYKMPYYCLIKSNAKNILEKDFLN